MRKLKTKKAALKRFRVKPSGKIKHDHCNHEHIATKKTRNRKNRLKKPGFLGGGDIGLIRACLPNHR